VNETAALVFFQYAFGRKHLETAETNVRTMPIFAAMSDQSTQVLHVDVVMLLRVALIVQNQQCDGVQPLMNVRAEVENRE